MRHFDGKGIASGDCGAEGLEGCLSKDVYSAAPVGSDLLGLKIKV